MNINKNNLWNIIINNEYLYKNDLLNIIIINND